MKKIIALLLVLCLLPVLAGCGFAASEPDEEAAKLRVQPLEGEPKEPDTRGLKHYELDNGISFYATGGMKEIEVEGKTMNARVYSGEMKVVHLLDLAEYMRNCGIPEYEELAASLLRVFNIAANRNYLSFSSHFYDGMFGDFDLNESFGTLEMVLAYDDELTYTRETVSEGEEPYRRVIIRKKR